jgi:hypothetical protein
MHLPLLLQRRLNKGKPAIKTYWWRYRYPEKMNFGDEITQHIVRKLWGLECEWSEPDECEFVATGSILHILQDIEPKEQVKVWGSGFIKDGPPNKNRQLNFYAVRGPLTATRTGKSGVTLGDPGILANLVFQPSNAKRYKVGIVAHYVDAEAQILENIRDREGYLVIDPLQEPHKVAQDITACEYVLSSSLHGLIFADSFGIPNNWMPLSEDVVGGSYKFEDYYRATNRPLKKVEAASILSNSSAIEEAVVAYESIPNIKKLQKELIKSFPYQINFDIKAAIFFVLSPSKLKKLFR